jgi:hypothetical protein
MSYEKTAKRVSAKLRKAGMKVSITSPGDNIDPVTGAVITNPDAVVYGYGIKTNYTILETDGTEIQATDTRLLFEATAGTPEKGMLVTLGTEVFNIINIMKVEPTSVTLLYKLQLRK